MERMEGTFPGTGGLGLYYQRWRGPSAGRAILTIVHGFGEHSGRYGNVIAEATARGMTVYGFDHRGHGRSPGQRGHIDRWEDYRGDVKAFLGMVGKNMPNQPIFLFGHSMGALIALDYLLRYPEGLRGAIISGAPFEPVGVAKPYLVTLARILSRIWPKFSLSLGLDPTRLSRDREVVKAYEADPLVHGVASVRWGTETLKPIAWVKGRAGEVRIPILLIHGGADRINAPDGSRSFFEKVSLPDRELKIYPGSFHEPHNDLDYRQVVKDVFHWLERHLH